MSITAARTQQRGHEKPLTKFEIICAKFFSSSNQTEGKMNDFCWPKRVSVAFKIALPVGSLCTERFIYLFFMEKYSLSPFDGTIVFTRFGAGGD